MADPIFNLPALQTTTSPLAQLVLVNGPIAKELEINSGVTALGSGMARERYDWPGCKVDTYEYRRSKARRDGPKDPRAVRHVQSKHRRKRK